MTLRPIDTDTIAAIATAPGRGGIGVIRLSGNQSQAIAAALTGRSTFKPRYAHYCRFMAEDDSVIDDGLTLYFPAPGSFTGEDVIELQGHGGPVVLAMLLERCLNLGARQARAGEFSERAYLNDKLDLVQAEAISDLINAQTQSAARQAQASLRGTFSKSVGQIAQELLQLRMFVEAAIDFPEEEIDFLAEGSVAGRLTEILNQARTLRRSAKQGAIFRSGATVVLAGKPNAGKSSLLNQLAGDAIAIVTDQPGTTRDVVREYIELDGVPLRITDTAGLRTSSDAIEQEGIRRAHKAIAEADLTLELIDDAALEAEQEREHESISATGPHLRVFTKIDLSGREAGFGASSKIAATPSVAISNATGAGIAELKQAILEAIGLESGAESLFSARERHLTALDRTLDTLSTAETQFLASGAGELLAEDLRLAHDHLGDITGKVTNDEVLGEIFSSFCIGK